MAKIYKVIVEHGYYLFKLEVVLAEKKVSKSQLARETNTDFKVINRFVKGDLIKLDLDVLARITTYLDCEIKDLIEYYPNNITDGQ